jgi:signal transduction histidine kinase
MRRPTEVRSVAAVRSTAQPVPAIAEPPAVAVRLEDAARVAARVAHDFDNVLMGVMGFAELAQPHVPADSPAVGFLAEILKVASETQTITKQLHLFNRCGRRDPRPCRVDDVCRSPDLAEGVRVKTDVPDDLPSVAMSADAVRGVVVPLIRNAFEATAGRGVVRVAARAVENDETLTDTLPGPLPPGCYVEITVTDQGPGISADMLSRLGREPFVTTKARGHGLGLPIVVRTLSAHGGGVRIVSSPKGTAVYSYLPSADRPPQANGRNVARAAPLEVVPS